MKRIISTLLVLTFAVGGIILNATERASAAIDYGKASTFQKSELQSPRIYPNFGNEARAIGLGKGDIHAGLYNPVSSRWFNVDPALQSTNPYLYSANSPMMYVDPDGEFWHIVIAAAVGGVFNSVSGLISGDIKSVGHFFSSFGVGAIAGAGMALGLNPMVAGAFMGAANSTLSQGFNNGWNKISAEAIIMGGVTGGATAGISTKVSGFMTPVMNNLTGGIASPVIQQAVNQTVTGAASGFVVSSSASLLQGSSFKDAMKAGANGAMFGGGLGAASGVVSGFQYAKEYNVSPWTGRYNGTTDIQPYYPPNDGAQGNWENTTLEPGTKVDRYGDPNGRYFAPEGTPSYQRSLPHGTDLNQLNTFEVTQPLPVQRSIAAPWFNQPGGGVQYRLLDRPQYLPPGYMKTVK